MGSVPSTQDVKYEPIEPYEGTAPTTIPQLITYSPPFGNKHGFNVMGLRHPLSQLDEIMLDKEFLRECSLEDLGIYVDAITWGNTKNDEFVSEQMKSLKKMDVKKLVTQMTNITSVANLSYMALHANSSSVRTFCKSMVKLWQASL